MKKFNIAEFVSVKSCGRLHAPPAAPRQCTLPTRAFIHFSRLKLQTANCPKMITVAADEILLNSNWKNSWNVIFRDYYRRLALRWISSINLTNILRKSCERFNMAEFVNHAVNFTHHPPRRGDARYRHVLRTPSSYFYDLRTPFVFKVTNGCLF